MKKVGSSNLLAHVHKNKHFEKTRGAFLGD